MSQPITASRNFRVVLTVAGLLILAAWQIFFASVSGAQLGNRKLQISNSLAAGNSTYALSFDLSSAGNLGSIEVDVLLQ